MVQQTLKNGAVKSGQNRKTETSLLIGKLFDEAGEPLVPSHSNKQGKRYRYYVSKKLITGTKEQYGTGWRLPANELEETILRIAKNILSNQVDISTAITNISMNHISTIISNISENKNDNIKIIKAIEQARLKIDGIEITISLLGFIPDNIKSEIHHNPTITQNIPIKMKRRGVEMRLILNGFVPQKLDPILIKTIAKARKWFDDLVSGKAKNIAAIAAEINSHESFVGNILPLAFLSPDIIQTIIEGKQPIELTSDSLVKRIKLPMNWAEQSNMLNIG